MPLHQGSAERKKFCNDSLCADPQQICELPTKFLLLVHWALLLVALLGASEGLTLKAALI